MSYYFNEFNAKRHGRRDATFNFPASGEQPTGYLGRIERAGERHMRDEAQAFKQKDARLTKKIQSGLEREALEQTKLLETERAWPERGKKPVFSHWLHLVFIFLLNVGEFAINELAFRPFEERPIQTMLMTVLVGVVIVTCAHFLGRTLKKPVKSKIDLALMVAAIVIAVGVSFAVANARAKYISEKIHAPVVTSSRSVMPKSVPDRSMPISEDGSRSLWMFIVFQLGAFLAGTLTAYASADPLEEQRRKHVRAVERREHAYTDREKVWDRCRERTLTWWSGAKQIEAAYVGENVKHRTDGVQPGQLVLIEPNFPDVFVGYPAPPTRMPELDSHSTHLNGKAKMKVPRDPDSGERKEVRG